MIRYIYCVRKRPDISLEDFRQQWNSPTYKALLKRLADYYQAARYSRNLSLKIEMGETLVNENGLSEPYDVTIELFWDSANKLPELYDSEEAQKLTHELREIQQQFIDTNNSTLFFTTEQDDD